MIKSVYDKKSSSLGIKKAYPEYRLFLKKIPIKQDGTIHKEIINNDESRLPGSNPRVLIEALLQENEEYLLLEDDELIFY